MAVNRLLLRPYIIVIVFLGFSNCLTDPMSESEALLKLKSSFTITKALDSWFPGSPPCGGPTQWKGIICHNGVVSGLTLQGLGLSGTVDVTALRRLRGLRIIGLANNSFSGPIPELSSLAALRAIYLSDNQFSGDIPAEFFARMAFLKKLWLSRNKFSGSVPSSISQLSRLVELHLADNRFGGRIPPLDAAPNLASLDLSGNAFEGEVPASLAARFDAMAFAGNPGLCGGKLGRECPIGAVDTKKVAAAAITSAAVIVTVAALLILRSKRRMRQGGKDFGGLGTTTAADAASVEVHVSSLNKKEIDSVRVRKGGSSSGGSGVSTHSAAAAADIVMVNEEKGVFGMPDLMKASAEVLGGGGMGSSYKAVMANGVAVVVKRIKDMNVGGKDHFDAEMRRLGSLKHWNVLSPLAYHFRKEEKLVVSEYVPNGSLLYLLHGERGSSHIELNWPARLKLVQGIAKGLAYIHAELASLDLPHGNLKSSNVLIGPVLDPLLSDYGFAALINPAAVSESMVAYKAPEGAAAVSPKSDVYCLGVVILEILTGKFPSQYLSTGKGGTDVVRWAAAALAKGREAELLDPEIAGARGAAAEEMRRMLRVGAACAGADPELRPSAAEALRRIEEIGGGGGGGGTKLMQVLPSLRDGYADSVAAPPQAVDAAAGPREDYGEVTGRRRLKNGDSFAFSDS